jgi:hypothetical protein
MKKVLLVFTIGLLAIFYIWVSPPHLVAKGIKSNAADITNSPQQKAKPAFEKVFDIIALPNAYLFTFDQLMRKMGDVCKKSTRPEIEQDDLGNVECVKDANVHAFTFYADEAPVRFIGASFYGVEKCTYMKKILIMNFGKPTKIKKTCELEWNLKPVEKKGFDRFINLKIVNDVVDFSIGEDDHGEYQG